MQQYQKKNHQFLVEAVQLTADNVDAVANWAQAQIVEERDALSHEASEGLNIKTPAGKRRASRGMYVIKHEGRFFVSPAGTFESQYFPAS